MLNKFITVASLSLLFFVTLVVVVFVSSAELTIPPFERNEKQQQSAIIPAPPPPLQWFSFSHQKNQKSNQNSEEIAKALSLNQEDMFDDRIEKTKQQQYKRNRNSTTNPIKTRNGAPTPTSPICPLGSTAEGIWGVNSDPYFESSAFYHHEDPLENLTKTNKPFGLWTSGPRTAMLKRFCRHQKNPHLCDWNPKPHGWNPFSGSKTFWVNETAAIYSRYLFAASIKNINTNPYHPSKKVFPTVVFSNTTERVFLEANDPGREKLSWCYDFQSAAHCLTNKVVVFVGDSHIVNLAQTLCRMAISDMTNFYNASGLTPNSFANYSSWTQQQQQDSQQHQQQNKKLYDLTKYSHGMCGGFDPRFKKELTAIQIPGINVTIAVLRTRYQLEEQWYRFDASPWAKYLERANFVVTGRGIWDLVYLDTPRKQITTEFAHSLKFLAWKFPFARIIVKMLHYDHQHMKNCSTNKRMREVRDSNICSLYIAQTEIVQELNSLRATFHLNNPNGTKLPYKQIPYKYWTVFNKEFDPHRKFGILDFYGASREVPYGQATDKLGHHYEGSVMESMVQQMLSVFCPAVPQNHSKMFRENFLPIAKRSCKKILDLTEEDQKRVPHCSCLHEQAAMIPNSLEFCRQFYDSKNHFVAYFTDV